MTQKVDTDIVIERKVPAVMSDGTTLYSNVCRPKAEGRYPVIVERVGYELDARLARYGEWYASRGYVFVGQNTRGTFWSEGEFNPFVDDGWGANRDGYETIEWAAAQRWSNGNVGTMDGSWSGFTQNLLAPTRPPHLRTMFLRMAPATQVARDGIGGMGLRVLMVRELLTQAKHPSAGPELRSRISDLEEALKDPIALMSHLPANEMPLIGEIAPHLGRLFGRDPSDPANPDTEATRKVSEIDIPVFHLGGWFDPFLPDTLAMFTGISEHGMSEHTRETQRMQIGPWVHGPLEPDNTQQGDLEFGPEASLGINEFRLRWFDHWLRGRENGADGLPRVRLFIMGPNRWRDFDSWPPPGATASSLYLRARPGADQLPDGGLLSFDPPREEASSTSYDYDPFDPVPFHRSGEGRRDNGPIDLAEAEKRKIVFTSAPLEKPMTVVGPLSVRLFAKSSARDTDWFLTLTDVYPDGRSIRVQEGALRARYREGLDHEVLMEPGRPYLFEIDLQATAKMFAAGHRIRLAVTSSMFPHRERNMNTGGINQKETSGVVAHNSVLHEREHPSHLVLPVME